MLFLSSSKVRAKAKKNKKRQGLRETLIMHCLICKSNVHTFETSENVQSEKGNRMKDINLRSAAATLSMAVLQSYVDCVMTLTYLNRLMKSLLIIIYHTSRHVLLKIVKVDQGQQHVTKVETGG